MVFRNLHQFRYLFNFDDTNWTLREKRLSIYCFMLVPGMANHTPRNWPYWHSTDWYREDISLLNAWIHSFGFTTNVRTVHTSTLFICGYFVFWNDGYLVKNNRLFGKHTRFKTQIPLCHNNGMQLCTESFENIILKNLMSEVTDVV